jgi:hypothetical protein
VTAARLLAPEKLQTVYKVQPKRRDTFVLTGILLSESDDI